MVFESLTRDVLGACFEVGNELGIGFLESVYEKSLLIALSQRGLSARAQTPLPVMFRGRRVGVFYADLLVENTVVVEIKAVRTLALEHKAQLINYLTAARMELGILVNFGTPKIQYKRVYRR